MFVGCLSRGLHQPPAPALALALTFPPLHAIRPLSLRDLGLFRGPSISTPELDLPEPRLPVRGRPGSSQNEPLLIDNDDDVEKTDGQGAGAADVTIGGADTTFAKSSPAKAPVTASSQQQDKHESESQSESQPASTSASGSGNSRWVRQAQMT